MTIVRSNSLPLPQALCVFAMAAALAFSLLLFACSETPIIDYSKEKTSEGTNCIVEKGTDHAFDVYCADVLMGYLDSGADGIDGKDGADGINGADGTSCEIKAADELGIATDGGHDYTIYCGDKFVGYLNNGKDGEDGEDGDDCSVAEVTAADVGYYPQYALKVTCGGNVEYLKNGDKGDKGEDGTSCDIREGTDGNDFDVYCAETLIGHLNNGEKGDKGEDGTSCDIRAGTSGNDFDVYCAEALIGHLNNGKDGEDGKNGEDGEDCSVAEVTAADAGYYPQYALKVTCGENVEYLKNGDKGEKGDKGEDGTSCDIRAGTDGNDFDVYCAGTLIGHLNNGEKGDKGDGGTNCDIRAGTDGNDFDVYCAEALIGYLNNGEDGEDGDDCSVAEVTAADAGYYPQYALKVTCGENVEYLKNGDKGEKGDKGEDGTSCDIRAGTDENDFDVYCAGTLIGHLNNGEKGDKGDGGTSCDIREGTDGNDFDVYCAEALIGHLNNGKDGDDGDDCSVEELKTGDANFPEYDLKVTCGTSESYLKNGAKGDKGEDGTSCDIRAGTDENDFDVYCAGTLIGHLNNGEDGTSCDIRTGTDGNDFDVYCAGTLIGHLNNGKDGDDGEDGDDCSVEELKAGDANFPEYDLKVTCGVSVSYLKNGEKGDRGEDGDDCSVAEVTAADAGYYPQYALKVTCGENVEYLKNGEDGSNGTNGTDGTSCWTTNSGAYYEIWCGTSSSSSKSGQFPKAMCGSTAYDPETHFCDIVNPYTVAPICNEGKTYNTATRFCDARDSTIYKKVQIGSQVWMAENLNYNASGSWCYNDNTSNCVTYGRLYDWATAMAGSASSAANPSGVQGVCPVGWHLPSDSEWSALASSVGGASTAGTKLKANSSLWNTNTGTDDYGFSALPGGGRSDGSFFNVGDYGYWWSATEYDASYAYYLNLSYNYADLNRYDIFNENGFSVRCLRD